MAIPTKRLCATVLVNPFIQRGLRLGTLAHRNETLWMANSRNDKDACDAHIMPCFHPDHHDGY